MTIRGITVPKGTMMTASGYALHMDPEVWENPEEFDPDRYAVLFIFSEFTFAFSVAV